MENVKKFSSYRWNARCPVMIRPDTGVMFFLNVTPDTRWRLR